MAERGEDTRCQHVRVVRELKGHRPVSRCRWGREVLGWEAPDPPCSLPGSRSTDSQGQEAAWVGCVLSGRLEPAWGLQSQTDGG